MDSAITPEIYQGYYGEFTITDDDRRDVLLYRGGLAIAALCFSAGTSLMFWRSEAVWAQHAVTIFYGLFCSALGVSLAKIHIYLVPLHRLLQVFWGIGCAVAIALSLFSGQPLVRFVVEHPVSIWGIGFTFAALTGIFFKEGFCFRRVETMLLTPLVPLLLLGHLTQLLSMNLATFGFITWSVLFVIFAARKFTQPPAADIGDKSVFDYLKQQKAS
ncbi:Protein of unknown function DUF2301, transmembrane [[Leptolyngbya] sp. PCC 7376]|uniref:DUF2301 domain-containing membrane protein n=1 Tax=[Leptolyngbya] sp. PCC 7376 TaxID=111781 RepID=UPI00029F17A5|nr:DUF2301 domain-containing membrane protein [[Leptolyngbya] sp. PCC 7376]AFY38325.1 Protein of unknown function DUF2301, transmembrane [[Leptolyngbya] sp. PCC 7376]